MADWLRDRVPPHDQDDAVALTSRARRIMRQYLIATALTGLIDGVLIAIALWVLGVPLVVPLAVLTFLGGFVPIVGATVAGLVAAVVALVANGLGAALLVVAATVAIQQIEGNLLQPLILERAVRLHPLVTVWAVGAGLLVGGLLGAFLSVPLIAIAVGAGSYYRGRGEEEAVEAEPPAAEPPAAESPPPEPPAAESPAAEPPPLELTPTAAEPPAAEPPAAEPPAAEPPAAGEGEVEPAPD
jgi:predicted PurR-regulated permease PerM